MPSAQRSTHSSLHLHRLRQLLNLHHEHMNCHTQEIVKHICMNPCVCVVVDIYSYMISRYHIRNQNMTYGMSVYICIIYIIDYFYTNQYTIILYTFVCVHVGAMIHAHIHCTYPVLLLQMLIQRRSWPIENLAA